MDIIMILFILIIIAVATYKTDINIFLIYFLFLSSIVFNYLMILFYVFLIYFIVLSLMVHSALSFVYILVFIIDPLCIIVSLSIFLLSII